MSFNYYRYLFNVIKFCRQAMFGHVVDLGRLFAITISLKVLLEYQ